MSQSQTTETHYINSEISMVRVRVRARVRGIHRIQEGRRGQFDLHPEYKRKNGDEIVPSSMLTSDSPYCLLAGIPNGCQKLQQTTQGRLWSQPENMHSY